MSPGAKMEYLEAIYVRYKQATRKEKHLFLMNSVKIATITESTRSEFLIILSDLQSLSPKSVANLLYTINPQL